MRKLLVMSVMWSFLSGALGSVFYVSSSGSHVSPFSSVATGATNIQSAADLAGNDDTVLIGAGNYLISSEITISSNILLKGSGDPLQTVVDGGGFVRCFNLEDVACTISGLTITNGYTADEGGGILCNGLSATITNCIIVGNHADVDGGGVYLGRVYDSVISGNMAEWGGGTYDTEIYNSMIANNTAVDSGGGVLGGLVQYCVIKNNKSLLNGASLFFSEANNCVIRGNIGGGTAYSDLYSCTVVSNSISGNGGGTVGGEVYNSIIYYNTATEGDDNIYDADGLHYSCSPDTVHGVGGNITTAPVFVNIGAGDSHLQASSPCKNTGNNADVSVTIDLEGNTRIIGGIVDMGAYELQGTPMDLDGDGMLDDWEIQYFLDGTNAMPNAHGDTDQFTNLEEYIAGTDPTNPASFFAVTNGSTGSFVVGWPSVATREYKVLWTESLTNSFQQLGSMIDHPQNSYTDTLHSAEASGFYKVEVRLK